MNPANPGDAQGQQQQQQPQKPSIMKMILMYMAINWVFSNFFGPSASQKGTPSSAFVNVYQDGEPLEFKLFITSKEQLEPSLTPVWEETGVEYNYNKENYREKTIDFNIDQLLADPTLYAHFVMTSARSPLSENFSDFAPYLMQEATINLIDWRKKDANLDKENLLFSGEEGKKEEKLSAVETVDNSTDNEKYPHLRSRVWIQLVHDTNPYLPNQLPPEMRPKFIETELGNRIYMPILDTSQFWTRKKDYILLDPNAENKVVNTTFSFNTYWIYKYMMESTLKKSDSMYGEWGMGDNLDEVKEMVLDANPILFSVTMVVSLLHSLFEFLALKNEISFWRNLESHKGLSLRTLWVSLFTEIIVILYLLDNETSFLILVSTFAEIGVTVWKIFKTTKFRRKAAFPYVELDYQDAYKSTTMEYDQVASKYLMWLFIPLLAGYTVYSLLYEKHKGWYSFVVQTLVGFIYVFGFIEMTPQLYINYKLKSVEHLPWRVLIYKFLNTIVDDLFAFVITMPWLKRLSCFRDDIIFIIYLYQRWIYRVDKNRDPYGNIKKEDKEPVQGEQKELNNAPANKPEGDSNITHRNVEGTTQASTQAESQEVRQNNNNKPKNKKRD